MWHTRHGEHCVQHVDHSLHLAQTTGEWIYSVRYVVMSDVTTCLNVTHQTGEWIHSVRYVVMSGVTTCLNVTHPTRRTLCPACRPLSPPGSNNRWVDTFCQVRRYEWRHYLFKCDTPDRWVDTFCQVRLFEWRHYLFKCDTPDTMNIVSSMSTTLSTWLKQQVSEYIVSGTSLWVTSLPV